MRWVGEALLIFLSIMLAFYIENYREQRSREKAYINHLKAFHFDLTENQGKMAFDLKEPRGVIADRFIAYDSLLNLLTDPEPSQMPEALALIRNAERPLAKWFFQSPHLDMLMTEYYVYVKNVELKRTMSIHKRRMQFIGRYKDELKVLTEKLHPYYDQLDRVNPSNRQNLQVLKDRELYNLILRLERKVRDMKSQYLMTRTRDSLICLEIEKELALWKEKL